MYSIICHLLFILQTLMMKPGNLFLIIIKKLNKKIQTKKIFGFSNQDKTLTEVMELQSIKIFKQ